VQPPQFPQPAAQPPRAQPLYSPDGQWWWDGYQWRPVGLPAPSPGLFWFFEAPDWAGPALLMALIGLIPVVGGMVLFGWVLAIRDNLRRGLQVLPPASFSYLERGVWVVVVLLVYALAFLVVEAIVVGVLVGLAAANGPVALIASLAVLLGFIWLAWLVIFSFLLAALISLTDRYGASAGLNPARLWRAANANLGASWKVAGAIALGTLIIVVVSLIPLVGLVAILGGPFPYLMAAPYLAQFDETRAA
jgi:uncharacterized protein DUF4013